MMPGVPPMGAPPAPPMAAPPGPAPGGLPLTASPYADLSAKMSHGFQLLDAAARTVKMAMDTGSFYRQPEVLAAVRQIEQNLTKLVRNYAHSEDKESPPRGADDEAIFSEGDGEGDMIPTAESAE